MTLQERIADLQRKEGKALAQLDRNAEVFQESMRLSRGAAMEKAIFMNPGAYQRAVDYGEQWRKLARQTGTAW